MLSASADKSAAIWDLRINKRVLLLTDKTVIDEDMIKAKFMQDSMVVCAWSN